VNSLNAYGVIISSDAGCAILHLVSCILYLESCILIAMSAVAGILLILLGGASLALGGNEILNPNHFPPLAARTTAGLGLVLIVVGLLHFRAPHKAFLISIPVLLYFHIQMYFNCLYYFNDPRWGYQGGFALISILVLILSYKGYISSKAKVSRSSCLK
jgi:hypothetical protein